ncbi:MAG: hypothetical protein KA303_02760, partial [Paludibacter sp.]|nr:hypothetical protein [Paludibacter sp.]
TSFNMVTAGNEPLVPSCSAFLTVASNQNSTLTLGLNGLSAITPIFSDAENIDNRVFDMLGRQVYILKKNTPYIKSGKVFKSTVDVDLRTIQP